MNKYLKMIPVILLLIFIISLIILIIYIVIEEYINDKQLKNKNKNKNEAGYGFYINSNGDKIVIKSLPGEIVDSTYMKIYKTYSDKQLTGIMTKDNGDKNVMTVKTKDQIIMEDKGIFNGTISRN
jgi:hypothetical protein